MKLGNFIESGRHMDLGHTHMLKKTSLLLSIQMFFFLATVTVCGV